MDAFNTSSPDTGPEPAEAMHDRKQISHGHPFSRYIGTRAEYAEGDRVTLTEEAAEGYETDPGRVYTVTAVTIGNDETAGPASIMYDLEPADGGAGFRGAVYLYEIDGEAEEEEPEEEPEPLALAVSVDCDGSAFYDDGHPDPGPELARILRRLADWLETGAEPGPAVKLYDANGNACGTAQLFTK